MTDSAYALAAVMSTRELERLYSGLSLLVSAAVDGTRIAALAGFGALEALLDPDLLQRAGRAEATPTLTWAGRDTFARSLAELRDTALELDALDVYACSASVDTMGLTAADVEARLRGVMSTPRFLRETAGARLLFV
jgi:peroxiredoxin family protein